MQHRDITFVLHDSPWRKYLGGKINMFTDHVNCGTAQSSAKQRYNRLTKAVTTLGLIFFLVQSTGCMTPGGGCLDQPINGYRNHVWANRAYNLRYGNCERDYPAHFKQGFIDGYCDMCNGGDGYVPAVPPEDYWSYQYQSAEGAKCVNTWFKSYPMGVKAAREDGSGSFQKVYISKMIQSAIVQDKADHVLPDDVPVVAPEKGVARKLPVNPFSNDPSFDAVDLNQRTAITINGPNTSK